MVMCAAALVRPEETNLSRFPKLPSCFFLPPWLDPSCCLPPPPRHFLGTRGPRLRFAFLRCRAAASEAIYCSHNGRASVYRPSKSKSALPSKRARRCHAHRRSVIAVRDLSSAAGLPHDVGGDRASRGSLSSAIDRADNLLDWELRCHALFAVLASRSALSTDGLRRSIEALTPDRTGRGRTTKSGRRG